jgi:hypothetical protein
MFEGIPKKKPTKVGSVQTVDAETGEAVAGQKANAMTMLPPRPGVCQECAVDHKHDEPHNQQSLYYQMHFHARHGRWPTWTDAMAHCPDDVKAHWRRTLVERMTLIRMTVPDDLMDPPAPGR